MQFVPANMRGRKNRGKCYSAHFSALFPQLLGTSGLTNLKCLAVYDRHSLEFHSSQAWSVENCCCIVTWADALKAHGFPSVQRSSFVQQGENGAQHGLPYGLRSETAEGSVPQIGWS